MNILQINSSPHREGSNSTKVANLIVAHLMQSSDEKKLIVRDLAITPHPILDETALAAIYAPAGERTADQAARVALDDVLISEIQAADVIVLGVPMYNFGISAQLKNWFDAIVRTDVTFHYTEKGPEGLIKGKKVYVALARGGRYRGTENDCQALHLKILLSFLGMADIDFIYAEGLGMGPEAVQQAFAEAQNDISAVIG